VHEDVFAILPADKTIPFGVIEPLHCSLFHGDAFLTVEFAELKQRRFEAVLLKRYFLLKRSSSAAGQYT
jgi:hypothetical protein